MVLSDRRRTRGDDAGIFVRGVAGSSRWLRDQRFRARIGVRSFLAVLI